MTVPWFTYPLDSPAPMKATDYRTYFSSKYNGQKIRLTQPDIIDYTFVLTMTVFRWQVSDGHSNLEFVGALRLHPMKHSTDVAKTVTLTQWTFFGNEQTLLNYTVKYKPRV